MKPLPTSHAIRLDADNLVFTAHHFVAMSETNVEALHEHTFRVVLTVAAPLDANGLVIDFHHADTILRKLLAAWNGRVLLPREHYAMTCRNDDSYVIVTVAGHQPQRFDAERIELLQVVNASTELLAETLLAKILDAFSPLQTGRNFRLTLELQEVAGCWAIAES
ncbi:MAG: 6-pyruvoyl trahydropterin synthase family protein [Thermoguttaceae bacterium]